MKKKFALLILSTTLVLSACGAKTTPATSSDSEPMAQESASQETVSQKQTSQTEESTSEGFSELEAIGNIEVDEGLFDVELSIPADFVGETTQEELDALAAEKGYKSITLNADGSATYVMTKSQHKAMMDEMATSLNDTLDELVGSENYPNFTDIKANDDFTDFTITTKSTELDMAESFSTMLFYMYGGMYNIFNGTPVENVSVTFVNADSGEVISTANSADAEK